MIAIGLLALSSAVAAHFDLTFPASRFNTSELTEVVAPCGGLPIGNRTNFPIVGGYLAGSLYDQTATANFSLVVGSTDPTEDKFEVTFLSSKSTPIKNQLLNGTSDTYGPYNFTGIDLTGLPGVADGALATIQGHFITSDSAPDGLYLCADVVLKAAPAAPVPTTTKAASSAFAVAASLAGAAFAALAL